MTPQQVVSNFTNLHLASSITNRPIPSNKWWTDTLVADRSYEPTGGGPRVIQQDPYGGQLWAYPVMLAPNSSGFNLYFPNSWNTPANPNIPEGGFNTGPALQITGSETVQVGSNDILIADFDETNYPTGWITTGTAFGTGPIPGGTWPGESPAVTGFIGSSCVNTYRGANGPQGTLTSPTFTITKHFIEFLVGGGSDTNLDAVHLLIGTNVVEAAAGQQSGTLHWSTWDVSAYLGQQAQIQIVDLTGASWGFILCSFIVATDNGGNPALRYTSTYSPAHSEVTGWSDWGFQFGLPDAQGNRMDITLARGVPFVWTTCTGLTPQINFGSSTLYDTNGNVISTASGGFTNNAFAFDYQGQKLRRCSPRTTHRSSYPAASSRQGSPAPITTSFTACFLPIPISPSSPNTPTPASQAPKWIGPTTSPTARWIPPGPSPPRPSRATKPTPCKGGCRIIIARRRTTSSSSPFHLPHTARCDESCTPAISSTSSYAFHGLAPMLPAPQPSAEASPTITSPAA